MPGNGELVVETSGLRKVFRTRRGRHVVAVDGLDLAVPAGGVHGFLGPNGSGKTTTIRMLLGLARPSDGTMRLFGEPVPRQLPQVMGRIGAVVEEPKFVPSFTGRHNLLLLAHTVGVSGKAVDAALAQVGLARREKERYKGYSLGMKQRLAIAATLLKSPDLLILDEPTNGLDPAGIRDIRDMIRDLGESGVTVLLSSHILAEVQQVCHSVSIIGAGRLLASGAVDDLVGEDQTKQVRVGVADPQAAQRVLEQGGYRVTREGDRLVVEGVERAEDVTKVLAQRHIYVRELVPVGADLESVFLRLTSESGLPAPARHEAGPDAAPDAGPDASRPGRPAMRLLRVELSRFFSRRAVVLLLLAAALLTALIAGSTIWNTRPVSAADLASAKAQVEQQVSSPEFQEDLQTCRDNPEQFFGPGSTSTDCDQSLVPRPQDYLNRATLDLRQELRSNGIAVVVVISALMIVVGTTFAGSDWATGSMSNQLLFEPRRLRVWTVKAVAALLGCTVAAAVLVVAFWAALWLAAEARDIATAAPVQEQIRWMAARGIALAGLGGLGGYALTMLLRHTVGTLALLFVYAAGGEALLALAPVDGSARFSLTNNVFAWIRDGVRVYDQSVVCAPSQPMTCDQRLTISLAHGATYLGVLLLLTLVVSALVFRRRDVP